MAPENAPPDTYDGTQDDIRWDSAPPDHVAYGELDNDTVVFIPLKYGEPLADLRMALWSQSWGELREAVSEDAFGRILDRYGDNEERLEQGLEATSPPDEEPFSADELIGYIDGDWPDWPAQRMLDWVPESIARKFGEEVRSMLNGDYLRISPEKADSVAAALNEHGFECRRDDGLIRLASGWL